MTQTPTGRRRRVFVIAGVAVLAIAIGAVATTAYARQNSCDKLSSGQSVAALPGSGSSNSWRAEFEAKIQENDAPDFAIPVQITSPNGSVNDWEFLISEGLAHFNWEDSSGSYTDILSSSARVADGQWHTFQADVAQSGADIAVTLTVDGSKYGPSTLTGKTLNAAGSKVAINPIKENAAAAVKHFEWHSSGACGKLA